MLKNFAYYVHNYAQNFCHSSNVLLLSMDNDKLWLMSNWLNVKSICCALRIWVHCKLLSDNYLMPCKWHQLFYYCKSTFFCGMHFCLQYDNYSAYYASIMLDAFRNLLYSRLCQHNRLVPNAGAIFSCAQ